MPATAEHSTRRTPIYNGSAAVIAVLVVVTLLTQFVAWHVPSLRPYAGAGVVAALDVLGAAYSLRNAVHDSHRRAWLLLTVGRICGFVSAGTTMLVGGSYPCAGWWTATVARLAMLAWLCASLLAGPGEHLHGRRRLAFAAETAVVLGGGFTAVWYLTLERPSHTVLRRRCGFFILGCRSPIFRC